MERLAMGIEALKKSEYLMNSPVAFMVDLVEQYANGAFSEPQLSDVFVRRLNITKFYFTQMPKQLGIENLQVFGNELSLAEQLNAIMVQVNRLGKEEFMHKLLQCIEDYAATYTVRKPLK